MAAPPPPPLSPSPRPPPNPDATIRLSTAHGALRSFSQKEIAVYANHLNHCLGNDPILQYLMPINPNNLDLLTKVADGVLIARFIDFIRPDSGAFLSVNYDQNGGLNQYHIIENHNRNLEEAKVLGIRLHNVSAEDLRDAEKNPILVLGLMWQLIKLQFLSRVTIGEDPNLIPLLDENELPAEQLLIRWVNHHLETMQSSRRLKHFGSDLKDAEVYTILLASIGGEKGCSLEPLKWDIPRRAQEVLESTRKIGCHPFLTVDDIINGHDKFNMAFVAQLFDVCHSAVSRSESCDGDGVEEMEAMETNLTTTESPSEALEEMQSMKPPPLKHPSSVQQVGVLSSSTSGGSITVLHVWEQQRREELQVKAQEEQESARKMRLRSEEELSAFYDKRRERMDRNKVQVRKEEAIKTQEMNEILSRGGYWQQVAKLVDLKTDNPATERMRDMMIMLKNDEEKERASDSIIVHH